jgi:hypothetical protein
MESDEDRPSSGFQSFRKYGGKGSLEVIEFMVDGNPQRLKDASRGMGLSSPATAGREGIGNGCNKVGRCSHRVAGTAADDRVGDRPAGGLFAEAKEDVGQLGFFKLCEKFRGRLTLRRVEAHVEGAGSLKAETPARIGQLIGGEPKIQQDSVDPTDSKLIQDLGQLRITGLPQRAARVGETLGRPGEHQGIAIKTDEFSGGTDVFEDDAAMTAGSECAVDHDQSRREVEELNDFPYQDGTMNGRARVSRGPRRIRHCDGW